MGGSKLATMLVNNERRRRRRHQLTRQLRRTSTITTLLRNTSLRDSGQQQPEVLSPLPPPRRAVRCGEMTAGGTLMANVLVAGPPSSGKTSLVHRLQHVANDKPKKKSDQEEDSLPPATSPTLGFELYTLNMKRSRRRSTLSSNVTLHVRELGGKNTSLWTNYVEDISVVLYVVDMGNSCQISHAISQLTKMLDCPHFQDTSFGLVLNKRDSPLALTGSHFESMSGLNYLIGKYPNPCITIETSTYTMENIPKLLSWVIAQKGHKRNAARQDKIAEDIHLFTNFTYSALDRSINYLGTMVGRNSNREYQ